MVFVDGESVRPGQNYVGGIDDALAACSHAILVISAESARREWVQAEYQALVPRALANEVTVIPLLLGGELPPLLSTTLYIDLRERHSEDDRDRALAEILAAVRGERSTGVVSGPMSVLHPDLIRRPEGPHRVSVRIGPGRSVVKTWAAEAVWTPAAESALADDLFQLNRAQATDAREDLAERLSTLGETLASTFLGGETATVLLSELEEAERENAVMQVSLEVPPELEPLPWEALRLPGRRRPLALEPRVQLYRTVSGLGPTPVVDLPGPLRILAVVASPEDGVPPGRGRPGVELLDYEAELGIMLDALSDIRKRGASVRVLEWGSTRTIQKALLQERFHVLHISCHVTVDGLILEDEEGRPDPVDATRFVEDVLVPDRGVPLMVLARCSTRDAGRTSPLLDPAVADQGDFLGPVESFARGLLKNGVPGVLGMTQRVGDRDAVRFAERFYRALAERVEPAPLPAFSEARRQIETERAAAGLVGSRDAGPPWWHVPVLFLRGAPRPLHDARTSTASTPVREVARRNRGFGPRQVDDLVGRRSELRALLALMRSERPAALIRGLGGVGKTTVAERLAGAFADETAHVVAVVEGRTTPTEILGAVVKALRRFTRPFLQDDELKQAVDRLTRDQLPWREQLEMIEDDALPLVQITLILDEAEQNLHDHGLPADPDAQEATEEASAPPILDPELGAFLAEWLDLMPSTRLVVTSRVGLPLTPRAAAGLTEFPLGPLSRPEALKLMWRLPGIDALEREDQSRAYADVGGHPRALEYLDSLLRGDRPRNQNVLDRMEAALRRRGVASPEDWIRTPGRNLDENLAQAVTLVSSDVLLERLLVGLRGRTAHDLFALSSVYRQAVDDTGLNWVLAPRPSEPDPEREARLRDAFTRLDAAQRSGRGLVLDDLRLGADLRNQLVRDMAEGIRPAVHPGLSQAVDELVERNLLTVTGTPEAIRYVVHRWTALGLEELVRSGAAGHLGPEDLTEAHRRAAAFHEWRERLWRTTVPDLLEARFHHHAAGDNALASAATAGAGAVLYRWGEFDQLMQLCTETLTWLEAGPDAIELRYFQSLLAARRENWHQAGELTTSCLALAEQASDRRWVVMCEQQLGVLAQETGDYAAADRQFLKARDIANQLEDVALAGLCYSRRGALALARHHDEDGLFWSRAAVEPLLQRHSRPDLVVQGFDELRDVAAALGDTETSARLGRLAARRRETDRELQRIAAEGMLQFGEFGLRRHLLDDSRAAFTTALELALQLEDRLLEMNCHLGLGRIAQLGGRLTTARLHYRDHLGVADTLRHRVGTVQCYQFLGDLAKATGDWPAVQRWYGQAFELAGRIGDDRLVAHVHLGLGCARRDQGDHASAEEEHRTAEEIGRRMGPSGAQLVVEALLERAATGQERDLDDAERLYREARALADPLGDRLSVVKANLGLAAVARGRGDLGDGRALAGRALDQADRQGHPRLICDALLELGRIEEAADDPREATRQYLAGLEAAERLGDGDLMIEFCLRLGDLALGNDAFHWYDRGLTCLEQVNDITRAARLRLNIGRIALVEFQNSTRAKADFTRARELLDGEEGLAGGASRDSVEARLGLARTALAENDPGMAGRWFREALSMADDLGFVDLRAQAVQGLGVVSQLEGDLEAAGGFHSQAAELIEGSDPTRVGMEVRRDLARIAWRQGRLDEALAGYEVALELARSLADGRIDLLACAQQIVLIGDELVASHRAETHLAGRVEELRERYPEVICYPFDAAQTEQAARLAAVRGRIGAAVTGAGRPDEAVGFTAQSLLYQIMHQRDDADRQLPVLHAQQKALGERIEPLLTAILGAEIVQILLDEL